MNRTKRTCTNRFLAIDPDGNRHEIIEYTIFVDASEFGTPSVWREDKKEYKLRNGTSVLKHSDTEFEAMISGNIVKLRILP